MNEVSPDKNAEKSASALFEVLPLILFFVAYKMSGMLAATATMMVVIVGRVLWLLVRRQTVSRGLWLSAGLALVLGGATLIFRDPTFIKWKPTVVYAAFGVMLAGARILRRTNPLKSSLGTKMELPDFAWERLLWAWVVFLLALAALNLLVAFRFSDDTWVMFKLFGTPGITVLFVGLQLWWASRFDVSDD
jgi:intracellular septation protein